MRKHKPAKDNHRNNERIVELLRVPSRFEANVILAKLESAGVKASAGQNDSVGITPPTA